MQVDITFKCPECEQEITFVAAYAGRRMPCPECGEAVDVPDPDKEAQKRRLGKWFWVMWGIVLVALSWGLTGYLGPTTIRREIRVTEGSLREAFRTTLVDVRTPLPFFISFRIKGTDSKSEYDIDSTIIKYYFWFFRYKVYLPFKDYRRAPFFLKWVWLID
jgi:hypothetical protein